MRRLKPAKSDGSQGWGMAVRGTADWNRNEGASNGKAEEAEGEGMPTVYVTIRCYLILM